MAEKAVCSNLALGSSSYLEILTLTLAATTNDTNINVHTFTHPQMIVSLLPCL